jgi:hypothetical protein
MTDTNVPVIPVQTPPKEHPDNDRIAHGNKERSDTRQHPVARAARGRAGW